MFKTAGFICGRRILIRTNNAWLAAATLRW